MLVDRAQKRYADGSPLFEKQGIQWMMAESVLELYASKLMVLHAAYKIEQGMDFRAEVSMAKHHVANTLLKTVDRALQVHDALGYSNDSPLAQMLIQARWSRIADGSDEVHLMRIAEIVMRSYTTRRACEPRRGDLRCRDCSGACPARGAGSRRSPAPTSPNASSTSASSRMPTAV